MMDKKKKALRLWLCLLVINLVVIWGNSLLPGKISAAISNAVKEVLSKILPQGPDNGTGGGGLIRKLAHFTEFTCLGICLSQVFHITGAKKAQWFYLPLLCGMAAAGIDETIQCFVPERGPSIYDVGLDTLGVATGILIIFLTKRKKKTFNNMEENKL